MSSEPSVARVHSIPRPKATPSVLRHLPLLSLRHCHFMRSVESVFSPPACAWLTTIPGLGELPAAGDAAEPTAPTGTKPVTDRVQLSEAALERQRWKAEVRDGAVTAFFATEGLSVRTHRAETRRYWYSVWQDPSCEEEEPSP